MILMLGSETLTTEVTETRLFTVVLPRPFIFCKLQRPCGAAAVPNFTDPTGGAGTDLETNQDGKPDENALEDDNVDDSGSETTLHADSGVKEDE